MTCKNCGKEGARERLVTESLGKGADLLVVENVPLVHCPICGESYFTAKTLHELEEIRRLRRGVMQRNVEVAPFEV